MEARLAGHQPIVASHQASTLDDAVDGASDKLARRSKRRLAACTTTRDIRRRPVAIRSSEPRLNAALLGGEPTS